MTKREGAIITAFTGIMIGEFSEFHGYVEEIMQRPVFTHEMVQKKVADEIKEKSRNDFMQLNKNLGGSK